MRKALIQAFDEQSVLLRSTIVLKIWPNMRHLSLRIPYSRLGAWQGRLEINNRHSFVEDAVAAVDAICKAQEIKVPEDFRLSALTEGLIGGEDHTEDNIYLMMLDETATVLEWREWDPLWSRPDVPDLFRLGSETLAAAKSKQTKSSVE